MAYVGFSYLTGLLFASFFSFNINIAAAVTLLAAAIILGIVTGSKHITAIVCMICISVGAAFYSGYDKLVYDKTAAYAGSTVEIKGVLTDITDYSEKMSSYTVKGVINGERQVKIICYGFSTDCQIGDEIYINGTAALPKNTYRFNSLDYYKAKGIYLRFYYPDKIKITSANRLPIKRILCRYREYIYDRMSSYLGEEELAVAKAMIFGDKSSFDDSVKSLLYRAGIGHIMAVSGTHMSIVCTLMWFLISLLPLNRYLRLLILFVPMSAFVILSGASESVLRAAVMLILVYGGGLCKRKADTMNSLGIAVIILTASCPFAVRDASFLLSVTGVIGISCVGQTVLKIFDKDGKYKKAVRSIITSVCVSAVIFPVTFLFFDEVSVVSPISNLILLPFCSVILVSGVLSALFGGAGIIMFPLMKICGLCCDIVLIGSMALGGLRIAYVPLGYKFVPYAIIIALIIIAAAAFYFKSTRRTVVISVTVFCVCILSVSVYRFIPSQSISVSVLGNGSGSASVVIHDKKNASVIDLIRGGKTADTVAKYLNRNGIGRVELIGLNCNYDSSPEVYSSALKLFDVGTAIIPESDDENLSEVSFADNVIYYDSEDTSTVTMPDYTLTLSENNTVLLNINGFSIFAYNGKLSTDARGSYDVVICYAGKELDENISGKTVIFIDDEAVVQHDKNTTVYIDENVLLNVYKDKIESEVICGGSSY
jgi:ComEC/Rec2-related protein